MRDSALGSVHRQEGFGQVRRLAQRRYSHPIQRHKNGLRGTARLIPGVKRMDHPSEQQISDCRPLTDATERAAS